MPFLMFLHNNFCQKSSVIFCSSFRFSGHQRSFSFMRFDENITTRVEIGIFPIPVAYWLGFCIFKQNRDNPDEIGMVGHGKSVYIYLFPFF